MDSSPDKTLHHTRTGPWGKLEYYFTFLDPPDHFFEGSRREVTEWAFENHTREEAEALLEGCGIDVAGLAAQGEWLQARNGVIVRPGNEFVGRMSAEDRSRFYPCLLERMGRNTHLHEFVIERGAYRENVEGLEIPESLIELVETRSVRVGRKTVFAETAFALSGIEDPDLKTRFLKSLSRNRALVASLRIEEGMNLEGIADWWKAGPNRSRALPLLENALRTSGVNTLDMFHLLPPVPRRLLNTFPREQDDHFGSVPDCYWAAMNFFSETASSRYLDDALPRQYYFAEGFREIKGKGLQFGDVIVLVDRGQNRFVHAYIHIADDIIFTKNGSGRFFPYILMRRDDLLSRYMESDQLTTEVYRVSELN